MPDNRARGPFLLGSGSVGFVIAESLAFCQPSFPARRLSISWFIGLICNGGVTGVQRSTVSVPLRLPASGREPPGERTGIRFFLDISSEPLGSTHRPMQGGLRENISVSKKITDLAVSGLSCGTPNLHCIVRDLLSWHSGSPVVAYGLQSTPTQ